jgi:hypothetical protein
MTREIKFRAWHRRTGLMYWWNLLWGNFLHGGGYIGMAPWGESETSHIYKDNLRQIDPDECDIMQYTGLKDKNFKEIYEGDMVSYYDWRDNGTDYGEKILISEPVYYGGGAFYPICNQPPDEFEVIGNIYENPELLTNNTQTE